MFIIERRTAGVLGALAITGVIVALGNVWDRVAEVATPSTANSPAAFATSVGPGVTDNHFPGDRAGTEIPAVSGDAMWGRYGDLSVR